MTVNLHGDADYGETDGHHQRCQLCRGSLFRRESIVAVFGTSIGPPAPAYGTLNASGTLLNTSAGSTRVLFDGVPAPVVYASATQTNVMVPYEVAGRPTTSVVVEYQGVQSAPLIYNVTPPRRGSYTQNYSGHRAGGHSEPGWRNRKRAGHIGRERFGGVCLHDG